ncbi:MAG TPA: alginate export family protein [Bryobacteraceae bacterium]|nr:alginate export family protein [Bryobacteraceae bacterium]
MNRLILIVCLSLPIFAAPPQGSSDATPVPLKIGGITVTGSFRTRAEDWNWFQPDTGNNSYLYSGNLFRLAFSQSREFFDWQLEFAAPFLLSLPDNAIAPGVQGQLGLGASYFAANNRSQNSAMIFGKQGFLRFRNLGGNPGRSLKIGRFEFLDGSEATPKNATLAAIKRDRVMQRLIGNFGWSDVQRSFDGVQYMESHPGGSFTFVGAVPTRGVFQTNGWGETNTAFGYAAYTKPWGSGVHAAETRVLAIYYDDWRPILKTDNRPLAARRADFDNIRIGTYGGHHMSALTTPAGTIDLLAWGVAQTGSWGRLAQRAYAVDFEGGFQPNLLGKLKPWLRGGYTRGSGDGNPNDHTHGTFFQILPTPRPFARFPFFDMENNRDILGALIFRPHKNVTTSSEFHALALASATDLWYAGGGAFQPWTFGFTGRATGGAKSLANLYDTQVEWRMNRNLTATGYYGYAQGRAAIAAVYPRSSNGSLGYLELAYKF